LAARAFIVGHDCDPAGDGAGDDMTVKLATAQTTAIKLSDQYPPSPRWR
jgi:hypothetical protein